LFESKDHFQKELDGMMNMLFAINDQENPKMIYAILTTLAILSEEFAPEAETKYHN
jgi:hypothetical protein